MLPFLVFNQSKPCFDPAFFLTGPCQSSYSIVVIIPPRTEDEMTTYFASPQRTDRRKLKNQLSEIGRNPVIDTLLTATNGILVILNEDRQIVGLNHSFLDSLGVENAEEILGLRLGESLHCIHAHDKPAGCGTTEYCVSCGAAIAMMAAIRENREEEQICALASDHDGAMSDICLQVKARPIAIDGNRWILFYAQDITQEQFWLNMDRIFFHDVNNTLTALYGNVQLLELGSPENTQVFGIKKTVERLISEIDVQRDLSCHRSAATYVPIKSPVMLSQIRTELDDLFSGHKAAANKEIHAQWPDEDLALTTDSFLVSRVLGNMVINALEATPKNGLIRITAEISSTAVTWEVWNQGKIPGPAQKRIFQRHFSSKKGTGRGLGTYSMKLFGETYLKGEVCFSSTETRGTVFRFTLPR